MAQVPSLTKFGNSGHKHFRGFSPTEIDIAVAVTAAAILKNYGLDATGLRPYLEASGFFATLPDEFTLDWTYKSAAAVVGDFLAEKGGRQ
jgi:hypothetical protein